MLYKAGPTMLISSMTKHRTAPQSFAKASRLLPGRISLFVSSWTRIAEAECRVRAFTASEEIPLAWALEAAHTMRVGSARDAGGQISSSAVKTMFCTTCVFPEPP